jgi:hypothetical protein
MRRAKLLLLLALVIGCGSGRTESSPEAGLRVLFIGNSLTYANDLPAMVQALSEAANRPRLVYKTIALPDYSLEDHWNHGDARRAIAGGKWDVVVLQQGPSALMESRRLLVDYVRRFDGLIRGAGARTAVFMVWPSKARSKDFDGVVASYTGAAREVGALLMPGGRAWREAWRRKPDAALYASDDFHPSVAGSYLAAVVIYQQLYNDTQTRPPACLKVRSKTDSEINLSPEEAELLFASAREVNHADVEKK